MLAITNSCIVFLRLFRNTIAKKTLVILLGITSMFFTYDANAQQRRVSGLVTDISTGEALVGATITVKGKSTTVVSDGSGQFSIEAPVNSVLLISYTGFTELEFPAESKTVVDIKMARLTKDLDAVVVTGFGLTQKKATLSGAVSQLSGEELSRSKQTSAAGALVGKVAGLNFRQTSGQPGATPVIRVRNFGGDPLVVIDGTLRNIDAFNALDYNDIESVNILKDGSASIYGFGADNGVIVIVTKKGKRGQKPTLSFDTYYGTQTYANFNKPGDVKSYIRGIVQTETYGDGRQSVSSRTVTPDIYQKVMNGEPGYEGFDWYKYIYQSAPQYQAKLSVSGGTENSDYYISGSTLKQGVALRNFGEGFTRHNIQANFNTNISKRIRFGVQLNGYWSIQSNTNVEGGDFDWQAEAPYRNLPIQPGPGVPYTNPISGPYVNGNPLYPAVTSPSNFGYSYGLVSPELSGTEATTRRNISVNGNLEADIIKGLKARIQANYSFLNNQFDSRRLSPQLYVFNSTTNSIEPDPYSQQRNIDHVFTNTDNSSLQFQLEYQTSLGQHHIKAVASQLSQMNYAPSIRVQGIPPANNIGYIPNTGTTFVNAINDDPSNYTISQGYIINVNYDFAGKYIIEGHGRYDGSRFYAPADRWGFFPGGSVAYRISQEDFWKKSSILKVFNDFKIRASYGIIPFAFNQYPYLVGYDYSQGSGVLNGTTITGAQVRAPATPQLTWAKAHNYDVGIDVSMFNNRLSIGLDYYEKLSKGIPATRGLTLPDVVGFAPGQENLNSDKNRGFDGSIAWRDRTGGGVSYGFNASFSYGRSITGIRFGQIFGSDYALFRGSGNGRLNGGTFQYQAIGQFQTWEEIQKHPVDQDGKGNVTVKPGDFIFKDVNGDGFLNTLDQTRETYQINGGLPPLGFGFGFYVNYKGFDFRADFTGGSLYTFEQSSSGFSAATGAYMREWLPNRNTSQYLFDNSSYYSDPFDRNSPIIVGKYPLLLQTNPAPGTNFNHSGYQTNITYVKARNIEIGYTLPYSVLRPVGISQFRLYLSGNNVFNISNMPGNIDPELSLGTGGGLPSPRVLTIGAQVKF